MATSTELLRAAEHMRERFLDGRDRSDLDASIALMIEAERIRKREDAEAKRLQAIEAEQPKRSWPEGWPPFAVLRRAYRSLGVEPRPSTLWVSRYWPGGRYQTGKQYADEIRGRWLIALKMAISDPSSP